MSIVSSFLLGGAALIAGASLLVRGAARLARALGVSSLVVGLTVVAFGTSAPELAVTVEAALTGRAGVAVGNVVGSNVFNVLVILGLSAVLAPLTVSHTLVRREVPLMIGVSLLVFLLSLDGRIGRLDGLLLLSGAAVHTAFLFRSGRVASRRAADGSSASPGPEARSQGPTWPFDLLAIAAGLGLLIVGSRWLVGGAVVLATRLGVGETVVGLTIVAAGTSLPEVATSVLASVRGERDIAVGNVVGSNLFNLMVVLGVAGSVAPEGVSVASALLFFDMTVMVVVAVACLPIFFTEYSIARWEGWLFLAYYGAYATYLVMAATRHQALAGFGLAMVGFVVPLTLVTLVVLVVRQARFGKRDIERVTDAGTDP